MAQTTSDKTAAKLAALITDHYHEGPDALHGCILAQFRVVAQPATRGEQPEPAAGQTWRSRTSARLVKIIALTGIRRNQVEWECVDGSRGPMIGSAWLPTWTDRYDYEETA